MDILWSPWRYEYLKRGAAGEPTGAASCVFCDLPTAPGSDAEKYILHRASFNYLVLNAYPYISGHLLVVPFIHLADIDAAAKPATDELMDLTKRCQTALREVYRPHGFNVGMNLGSAAGAGVAGHYHQHIMPRWAGDVNFMTAVAETRVISETLSSTYDKLNEWFKNN